MTNTNYTAANRRLIGLPSMRRLYDGSWTLAAQTEYVYDSANETETTFLQAHSSAPSRHDGANYGASFLYRGNLTRMRRYSVNGGYAGSPIETKTGYYTTGTVAFSRNGLGHQTTFSYTDAFTGVTPTPATFAYPTLLTDPDSYSSAVKYNYDFGAVTEAVDPKSYAANPGNPPAATVNTYDSRGRLEKSAIWRNGSQYAYTRYVYGADHNWVQSWTTVNSLTEETAVLRFLDGADRERIVINEHPGSVGGLSSYYRVFDLMGRVSEWSRPTEIDSATWAPTGDDTSYIYSAQAYDWKGRPTVTTNADQSTREVVYTGCGCAGGDVVEVRGEEVPHDGTTGRRRRKIYHDVLGRVIKTEALNWNGSVYSTTTNTWNLRDQITNINVMEGSSGAFQNTTLTYDGYGRPATQRLPIYETTAQPMQFTYFNDDRIHTITDPRGAAATYGYNNRGLVTQATYSLGGVNTSAGFGYDAAGNRTSMTDGSGSVSYGYDALSRLETETRNYTGLGSYTLNYTYNLSR
ncbi:MAG: hypothetical protein KIT57_20365 [Blastocatellales bacterium]|nr:hypothetical protein [Blastocatellales bacterium]